MVFMFIVHIDKHADHGRIYNKPFEFRVVLYILCIGNRGKVLLVLCRIV